MMVSIFLLITIEMILQKLCQCKFDSAGYAGCDCFLQVGYRPVLLKVDADEVQAMEDTELAVIQFVAWRIVMVVVIILLPFR